MLLQVETDSTQAGRQPGRGGHAGRRPPDPAAAGASAPCWRASLSSPRRRVRSRGRWALGAGPEAAAPGPTSLVSDLSAQVFWTCRDGFRRRQRETSWNCSLAPSSRALSRPGCSCTKVLISSCPRLGAERVLGICHGVVGNFATVSRTEREEGLPCHLVPALLPGLSQRGRENSQVSAAAGVPGVTRLLTPCLVWPPGQPQSQQLTPSLAPGIDSQGHSGG